MRSIDHFVLVAASLSAARERYRRLGFTVAPDGVHPFGTYNANLYFRDGPMVETLAVHDPAKYADAVAAGNSFVRNDAAYRAALGDEGFSHVVATSSDAEGDHAAFLERGLSGGDLVCFSREFEQPDGSVETISAKLAFATPAQAPFGCYVTCEDLLVPAIDRSSLLDHENGALGAKRAVSCSREPSAYRAFLDRLFEPEEIRADARSVECPLPNGRLSVVTPEALARDFGVTEGPSGAELLHSGLVFDVTDLRKTEALLSENRVAFARHEGRLVVRPSPGPFFAFEQRP